MNISKFTILTIIFLFSLTTAEIKNIKITSDDSRPAILLDVFKFTSSGHLSISVESAAFASVRDPSRLAFCITPNRSTDHYRNVCILDSNATSTLFTFAQLVPPQNSFFQSYPIAPPSVYSLYFANCQPESRLTVSVTTEMYNVEGGGKKNYLPVDQTHLPILYFVFATAYFVFLLIWVWICVANGTTLFWTHSLMGGLILAKAMTLLCAGVEKQYIKVTGTPHGWDVGFCIFLTIRVTLLCGLILTIGTSWSILKSRTPQIITSIFFVILLMLQLVAWIAFVVISKTMPFIKNYNIWYLVLITIDRIYIIVFHYPISLPRHLFGEAYGANGYPTRNYKFTCYHRFSVCVFVYITSILILHVCFVEECAIEECAVVDVANEVITLGFYGVMFYVFRFVVRQNIYFDDDRMEQASARVFPSDSGDTNCP